MTSSSPGNSGVRFLSFANDREDAEKKARLEEAASKIEQAIAKEKSLAELVDYVPPPVSDETIDPINDTRPLYERLLEQQNKKKEALEESQKLSNCIARLDEDDIDHLNELSKQKREEEIQKRLQVYDLLEEQKARQEQKLLEEEKQRKESLLGFKKNQDTSSASSTLRSKFSLKLKMKPKFNKEKAQENTLAKRKSSDETQNEEGASSNEKDSKKIKIEEAKHIGPSDDRANNVSDDCCCAEKGVTKCIGILPSLPIVTRQLDEDDEEDSDHSDDDLNDRILFKVRRR